MNPGDTLGFYEIKEPLGAGGMGAVYRARDPRLERDVAIKVLPGDFATDPERLARFEREARLLAQLNHPNIAAIFGLEDDGERSFIVMEVVEGDTLADRIAASGALELDDALAVARQIAEALEAAHENGVVHRDLKPANIKVTPDGQVKVLDFGLAKAAEPAGSASGVDMSHSPTMAAATATGIILGTAAYMSPEQARGKPVDKRADIWAFGCVLYEMLTGHKAFDGETVSDAMAAILRAEPEWVRLPQRLPRPVDRLVRRCLVKEPRRRLRDIGDARTELEEVLESGATGSTSAAPGTPAAGDERAAAAAGAPRRAFGLASWLPAGLAAVVVGALAFWLGSTMGPVDDSAAGPVTRLTMPLPDGQRQDRIMTLPLAIAPDGSAVAYVARTDDGDQGLFIRRLDSFDTIAVPDSHAADIPFFSPDSRNVGFFSGGYIKRVSVTGGPPSNVAAASSPFGASWGRDGTIVYAPNLNGGLWRVSADGGEPERLSEPDFAAAGYAHVWPQHLPDGRHILFTTWGRDASATYVLDLQTRERRRLGNYPAGGAMYLASGHIGFSDSSGSGTFLAAPFDGAAVDRAGPASPVLADVRFMDSASAHPYLAVSETGVAVYVRQSAGDARLIWVDRQGTVTEAHRGERAYAAVRISPDGTRAVFHDEQGNLSLLDFERGGAVASLLRGTEFYSEAPIWHPSGERVTISSNEAGSWDIYEIDVAARGEPRPLVTGDRDQFARSWSADGELLAYLEDNPDTGYDIWVLPRDGEPVPVLQSPANEIAPVLSPDGGLMAFVSNETGRSVVSVMTYPGGERSQVSGAGGESPVWAPDGRELFYRQGDWLMSATVSLDPELRVSAPVRLIEARWDRPGAQPHFDIAPDGERFLAVAERPTTEFVVIQNWFEELRRVVPPNR
ncbi:MAG: protein kinase [Acidobacteriota bacterium]|jgi:Tol biopolymer transport system component